MSEDRDRSLALNIAEAFFNNRLPIIGGKVFASVHSNPILNLADKIEAALTVVRREARAEALSDAIAAAKAELWEDTSAGHGPHRAQQNSVINCVIDALENCC